MNDGILSLPEAQYRAAEGISKSALDYIAQPRTPAHYKAYIDGLLRVETTAAMRLGSMIHRVILEPDTADYVVKPEGMLFTTKEGRAWRDAQTAPIITADEEATIRGMRDAVWAHPAVKRVLAKAQKEVCVFASDSHGMLRKGRFDALPEGGNVIVDIKSCASASPDAMSKSMGAFRYDVQAAYYLDLAALQGLDKSKFLLVCVEKTPPFAVAVYAIDDEAVEWGRKQYQADLALLRRCEAEDHWPSFTEEITTLALPAWAQRQAEAVL